jgi:hypothetical protein
MISCGRLSTIRTKFPADRNTVLACGIVLVDDGHGRANGVAHLRVVGGNLIVGAQAGHRRHEHRAGPVIDSHARKVAQGHEAGIAGADDDRDATGHAGEHVPDERHRLPKGELGRLAHHAQDRDPVHALLEVELDEGVRAREIELPLLGKRRGGDDEYAARRFVEEFRHGCHRRRLRPDCGLQCVAQGFSPGSAA